MKVMAKKKGNRKYPLVRKERGSKVKVIKAAHKLPKVIEKDNVLEELNERQKEFCRHYIYNWNGTEAAIKAGYARDSASVHASRLLGNDNIKKYIKHIQDNLEEVAGVSRLMILQEHMKLAMSSIAHLHKTWIVREEFEDLSEAQKACIQQIETQTRNVPVWNDEGEMEQVQVDYVKIKLYDKQKSLDSINRMLGFDAAKEIKVEGNITGMNIVVQDEGQKKLLDEVMQQLKKIDKE